MNNQVDSPFGGYFKTLIYWAVSGAIFGSIFYYFFGDMFEMKGDIISVPLISGATLLLTKIGGDIWHSIFK